MKDTILKIFEELIRKNVAYSTQKLDRYQDGLMEGNRDAEVILRNHFPEFEDEFDALEDNMIKEIMRKQ